MMSRTGLALLLMCVFALPSTAQTVVANISVSGTPAAIAVNPSTNRIYVGLENSGMYSVDVIDGATNTVIDNIALTYGDLEAAVNFVTNRIYVAGCTYQQTTDTCGVTIIDGATNTVVATIPINASSGLGIEGIAVNPVTNRIYLSDATNFVIDAINGSTNAIIASVPTAGDQQPLGIAVDFALNEILVAINGDSMGVIDGSNNTWVQSITVGSFNANVAVNSFTSDAYITNEVFATSTVGVINLKTNKVVTNVTTGNTPFGVAVDIFSNLIFVTDEGDQAVVVVDGNTNTKIGSVTAYSTDIDVNPVTRLIYTSDPTGSLVHAISE
jgi:YVTN family beta-propeller protein